MVSMHLIVLIRATPPHFDVIEKFLCMHKMNVQFFFFFLMQEDNYHPHGKLQSLMWDSLHTICEPLFTRWPFKKLREKALEETSKHIHYEDENTRYITIGVVIKVIRS